MTSRTSTPTHIDDAPASAAHDVSTDASAQRVSSQARTDVPPGIPYRSMATLLAAALDQAQQITPPLARALQLDARIGADPHLRRAQQLLARLNEELSAELNALYAHTHAPVALPAPDAHATA